MHQKIKKRCAEVSVSHKMFAYMYIAVIGANLFRYLPFKQ